jgi:hypothetical protein
LFWDGELFEGQWGEFRERARRRGQSTATRWNRSPHYPDHPLRFVESCAAAHRDLGYGYAVKFFHLQFLGLPKGDFLQRQEELGFRRWLVLERRNLLRIVISTLVADARGTYHVYGRSPDLTRIHLDPERVEIDSQRQPLLGFLRDHQQNYGELRELLAGRNHLWLGYEESLERNPLQGYAGCCRFLGVEPRKVKVPTARTTPYPLSDVLSNFEEVRSYLQGTPFAWMLQS